MKSYVRPWTGILLPAVAAVAIASCGSSGSSRSAGSTSAPATTTRAASSSASFSGGTVNMLMGVAPQSLDPGLDYTTQGSEFNWLAYTGLTTYAHANGTAGTQLIPGLCSALPTITDGGKTYTCTLRNGLVFSNGKPVKASDFTYTVERAIKVPWGGSGSFITPIIQGATAYSRGKSRTISGIATDNATGKITIHLTAPYSPFLNVLAFPAMGIIPSGFPMKVQPVSPPPGVGPYMATNIVPNQSFSFVRNPEWSKMNIPGIPAGHVNINVKISSNVQANALAVLNNQADIFDWADTIPGSLMSQIQSQASRRFRLVDRGGSTYFIFFNVTRPPFNNQLVRQAVVTGLNQDAMSRLGAGTLAPGCFFLPPDVPGHPSGPCPYGRPGTGNIAKAKQLIKQSGMSGTQVTVWSETRSPRQQWMTYYTQFLNQIGLRATLKVIADATYWSTIGQPKAVDPQTGFADWNQDFPNPVDFYGPVLDGKAILPQNNENFGQVDNPYVNSQIEKLAKQPVTAPGVVSGWQALDEYVAKKAYVAVFGYQKLPEFTSNRINFGALVFQPIYGWDVSSFALK